MADLYLLPCPCGRKVSVEPRLAGQIIPCQCGAPLEVPTLLEMTHLERVADTETAAASRSVWGNSQRVALLGWVILVLALAWTFVVLIERPKSPSERLDVELSVAKFESGLAKAPPAGTLQLWWFYAEHGLGDIPAKMEKDYQDALIRYRFILGASVLIVLIGFGMVTAAHLAAKKEAGGERRSWELKSE